MKSGLAPSPPVKSPSAQDQAPGVAPSVPAQTKAAGAAPSVPAQTGTTPTPERPAAAVTRLSKESNTLDGDPLESGEGKSSSYFKQAAAQLGPKSAVESKKEYRKRVLALMKTLQPAPVRSFRDGAFPPPREKKGKGKGKAKGKDKGKGKRKGGKKGPPKVPQEGPRSNRTDGGNARPGLRQVFLKEGGTPTPGNLGSDTWDRPDGMSHDGSSVQDRPRVQLKPNQQNRTAGGRGWRNW